VKGKSSHDLLNDSTLSSVPAIDAYDDEDQPNYTVKVICHLSSPCQSFLASLLLIYVYITNVFKF